MTSASPIQKSFFRKKLAFLRQVKLRYLKLCRSRFSRIAVILCPYAGAILFGVMVTVAMSRHEMWRDEIQAWLLARGASTPWELFSIMKYEGHTCLWHLLIWPVAQLWNDPAGMQYVHIVIAVCSAFLLFRFAPFSWLVKIMIVCGYYFSYEWAVVSRNYAISALLLFAVCALYRNRWKLMPWIGCLLFLLCHTNVHSILISTVLLFFMMMDFAVAYAGHFRGADRYIKRCIAGFVIVFAGIMTSVMQIAPPDDSGYATAWDFKWNIRHAENVSNSVFNAFFPVPKEQQNFWNSNTYTSFPQKGKPKFGVENDKKIRYALIIFLCGFLLFFKRPWMGLFFLAASFALEAFFYIKYGGSWRHHGMLYLVFLASLWMSFYYDPWRLGWNIPEKILGFIDRHRVNILLPLFAVHIWGTAIAFKQDWENPFSMAKEAAAYLKSEFGNDAFQFTYVAWNSPEASTICGYLGAPRFYYVDRMDYGTYVVWDNKRNKTPKENFPKDMIRKLMDERQQDIIFIFHSQIPQKLVPPEAEFLKSFSGSTTGESYCLYRIRHEKKTPEQSPEMQDRR